MLKSVSAVVGLALGGLLLSSAAQAASFQNGSFENGVFAPDGNGADVLSAGSTTMTGWTVTVHDIAWITTPNGFSLASSDGSKFLDLTSYGSGAGGGVKQTFSTVAGGSYTVSFDLAGFGSSLSASAGSSTMSYTSTTAGTGWQQGLLSFVATGSSTVLAFVGTLDPGTSYIGLDNVQLTFNGVTTPIPASLLLFGTSMLGLGFAGYRRNKKDGSAAA